MRIFLSEIKPIFFFIFHCCQIMTVWMYVICQLNKCSFIC